MREEHNPTQGGRASTTVKALTDDGPCPKCGELGVGIIYGPYGCCACGWSEHEEYDSSEGAAPAEVEHPGYYADPQGGLTSKSFLAMFDKVARDDELLDQLLGKREPSP